MTSNHKKLKAVELFAGIGGFRIASDKLGFETIWANDFDSKACEVYLDNFGKDSIVNGDINDLIDEIPEHDILTAGFPCQPFSSAGKKNGIQDPRGTLFQSIAEVLQKRKPKYFVLENVKRLIEMDKGHHFATILKTITDVGYQIEWRVLNAAHYGLAQNRYRIFITGIKTDNPLEPKLFEDVPQTSMFAKEDTFDWQNIEEPSHKFGNWGVAFNGKYFTKNIEEPRVKKKSLVEVMEKNVNKKYYYNGSTEERINNSELVDRLINDVHILYNQKGGARMGYTIFGTKGRAPTLTASTSRHYERYKVEDGYRRLTPNEYARLQGFPDNHAKALSDYHQYKYYGNAVPPQMVQYCLSKLLES